MDHDGSGSLSVYDLQGALEVLGIGASEAECAALFSRLDVDHSDAVGKDEFVRFICADNSGNGVDISEDDDKRASIGGPRQMGDRRVAKVDMRFASKTQKEKAKRVEEESSSSSYEDEDGEEASSNEDGEGEEKDSSSSCSVSDSSDSSSSSEGAA